MPYLIGERGPEMFVPRSNGTIVPNNQMGRGSVIIQNVTLGNQIGMAKFEGMLRRALR